ncbi:MAG: potassium-transporting ATPase subunit KdpC [Rhizobacter sp.]|nr:potassium-transporting ATPase subunit KdpC [Burkholderiales bacterium]
MVNLIRPTLVLLALLTFVTGIAYPLLVTAIGQTAMADQANGSLVMRDGKPIGSRLLGQTFTSPKYFWGRPSATSPMPNNAASSSGANLGPTNPALKDAVAGRIEVLQKADPSNQQAVPIDLVTTSASGLDPDISEAAARYQNNRIAAARSLTAAQVAAVIDANREGALFGFLGEPRVNVLRANLALDALAAPATP